MPAAIQPDKRDAYFKLKAAGYSRTEAAKRAGFVYNTAVALERKYADQYRRTGLEVRAARLQEEMGDPVPYEELCDEAKRAWHDFAYFQRRYLGRIAIPWQIEAAERIVKMIESDEDEWAVINCPPGSGKSTCFSHDIPCWLTVRDRAITGLIGTAVQTNGKLYITNLKETFERTLPYKAHPTRAKLGLEVDAEATLAEDFGRFKPENGIWAADRFVVEQMDGQATNQKEPTWSCYGRKGGVLGMRYQFVIWDDLVELDRLDSQELIDEDREWYSDIAESRLEPGGTFILQGQRLGPNDLYGYALKMKRPAEVFDLMTATEEDLEGDVPKYAHIKFRAHYEDKCYGPHELPNGEVVYESHLPGAKPYPEGCLLFPRRLGWRKLEPLARERNERFQIVYQQEDIDPESVLVHKDWVNGTGGHIGCWDKERDRLEVPTGVDLSKCVSVVTVDPSPTQYWGVIWWLIDYGGEFGTVRYLINLERKGMGANKFLDYIAKDNAFVGLAEEWQLMSYELGIPITQWIVEKNGAQLFMLQTDMIQQWQKRHGVRIIPHTTTAANKNSEEFGVQALIPGPWERGMMRLPGKQSSVGRAISLKLVEEVTTHPHSRTFDLGMADWFMEIHLPELTRSGLRRESRHLEQRPSWMQNEYKDLASVAGVKLQTPRAPQGPQEMMRRFWAEREVIPA